MQRITGSILAILVLSLCADGAETTLLRDVPHVAQKPDFCGEACAAMALQHLGHDVTQDDVFNLSGLDPLLGRGCHTRELHTALTRIGFRVGPVWHKIEAAKSAGALNAQLAALRRDLAQGISSIVCMHYDDQPNTTEHFRLIVGYDSESREVVYHEPAIQRGAYQRMPVAQFLKLWPLKYDPRTWTLIRFRLELDRMRAIPESTSFSAADYAQHIRKLKQRLPSKNFHIVLQKPFVVIGDEDERTLRRRSVQTVKWAVDRLKKDYFAKDPKYILDIWLFKDKESYNTNAKKLFGSKPSTPFGYYSSRHRALVMNISTGGGTLVHEIVHPFIESNFPECPSWFNEGFASLYEQSSEKGGRIRGLTNWRLAGLQQSLKAKSVPAFKTLCETTTHEFYGEDPGTNYSQARYLCYYLQEHGLLHRYYHEFRKNVDDDPSGYNTLAKVLGQRDMQTFRKRWNAWVATLRF